MDQCLFGIHVRLSSIVAHYQTVRLLLRGNLGLTPQSIRFRLVRRPSVKYFMSFCSDARLSVSLLHRFEDVVTPRYCVGAQSNKAVTSPPALQT